MTTAMRRWAAVTGAVGLAVLAGCGLDVVGVGELAEAGVASPLEAGTADAMTETPTEWTAASVGTDAGCPTGTTTQSVVEGPTAGGCTCACGAPKVNPCTQANAQTFKIGGQNTTACGGGDLTSVKVTGGCDALQASGAAIGSLSCNGGICQYIGVPILPASGTPQPCDVDQKPASATSTSKSTVCVGAGASCVERAGDQTCPSGFPTKHVVYAEAAIKDSRVCSGCACSTGTSVTCEAPSITLYADANCKDAALGSGAVTGSCVKIAELINSASHFKYASKPSACKIDTPTSVASGTFDPGPPITLCCR